MLSCLPGGVTTITTTISVRARWALIVQMMNGVLILSYESPQIQASQHQMI